MASAIKIFFWAAILLMINGGTVWGAFPDRLTTDPVATWNTFLGSSYTDYVRGVAVDGNGHIYVTGSSRFAWGGYQTNPNYPFLGTANSNSNAFVAKLDGATGMLIWNAFLGSGDWDKDDHGNEIALDESGNVHVTGTSYAAWGTNPTRAYSGGIDAFVAKLNAETGDLLKLTFLGATNLQDAGQGIAARNGKVYVVGQSFGSWLDAPQPKRGYSDGGDAFVAQLNGSDLTLEWYALLGATGEDIGQAIAADASGNVYVAGTSPYDWGTPRRAHSAGRDAFAAKLNSSGDLQWNTFLGSGGQYYGRALAVDGSGNCYITGDGDGEWTEPPLDYYAGNVDAFVTKLDGDGSYLWHTFLGGLQSDKGQGIALNGANEILVSGESLVGWGNPINDYVGESDAFAAKLKGTGELVWNTFLGGAGYDFGRGITVDKVNNSVYVVGYSNTTWGTPVSPHLGEYDGFVIKLPYRTIFGRVTAAGVALGNVTMTVTGVDTTTTDDNGDYQFTVTDGWTGTVTPSLSGYSFIPSSRSYTNVTSDWADQDFSTSGQMVTISGYIKENPVTPVAGVTVTASTGGTTITDENGYFQISVNSIWSVTITPGLDGYTFKNPSNNSYYSYSPVGSDKTNQDFTATWNVYINGVITQGGSGLVGVKLNGLPGTPPPETGANGLYSVRVRYNWSGTVTPTMDHKLFAATAPPNEESRTYANVTSTLENQNFTADPAWYFSGRITEANGTPVSAVTLTNSQGGSTVTNDQGYYTLAIKEGWFGTVAPGKAGYSFGPVNWSYDNISGDHPNQDFTAGWNIYISGSIKDESDQGIAGVVLNGFPGTPTPTTDDNGNYQVRVDYSWSGTVTPAKNHYMFGPLWRAFSNVTAGQTGQDYTAFPTVYVSGFFKESDGTAVPGAILTAITSEPETFTTTTNETGYYQVAVKKGLTVSVTPNASGFIFSPGTKNYSNILTDQLLDFSATWLVYISGVITKNVGGGLGGVQLKGLPGNPQTDLSGNYRVRLSYQWSGTVTPTLLGYRFDPEPQALSLVTTEELRNFTAFSVPIHTISGKVKAGGAPLSGVVLNTSSGETAATDTGGNFQLSFNEGWSGTVAPTANGHTFSPLSRAYTGLFSDYSDQDFTSGSGSNIYLPLILK